jgi:zinc protease
MRRHASLLALLLAAACPALASAQAVRLPPITRITLSNGMRLILMEYHRAPVVSVTAVFPGGSAQDEEGKAGVASMMAELLRRGTTTRTARQLADEIEFLGADIATGADSDYVSAGLQTLASDAPTGLDLLADVLRNATFPDEEIERARKLRIAGLQALPQDPGAVAARVAEETAFAGHPYGRMANLRTLAAITRADLVSCYRRVVAPNRAIVAAVGDFRAADMAAALRRRFDDWPRASAAAIAPLPRPALPTRRVVLIDKPDDTQAHVVFVGPGAPRNDPSRVALSVADVLLGGGFTSRLVDEIRINRSLTYGIGSDFDERLSGGSFEVSTFTKVETTRRLIDATASVLARTASAGLTAAELRKAKGYLAGQFAISVQTPEALSGRLARNAFYGLPDDELQTYLSRLGAVTLADVDRVARSYFDPKRMSLVVVGPAARIRPTLSGLGPVTVRPVEDVAR